MSGKVAVSASNDSKQGHLHHSAFPPAVITRIVVGTWGNSGRKFTGEAGLPLAAFLTKYAGIKVRLKEISIDTIAG